MIRISRTTCFNCKSLDLLLVVIQKNANKFFFDSMFVLHAIIWLYRNSIRTFCWHELWVSYMRSFFSIEVSWNDFFSYVLHRDFWTCVYVCFILKIWKIAIIATFASNMLTWKIIVIVILASNFILLAIFNQSALKIWENIFVNDSKKAWFDDSSVLLLSISKTRFRTICDSEFDDWQLTVDSEIWIRVFIYLFFLSAFYIEIDELLREKKKWLIAKNVE